MLVSGDALVGMKAVCALQNQSHQLGQHSGCEQLCGCRHLTAAPIHQPGPDETGMYCGLGEYDAKQDLLRPDI